LGRKETIHRKYLVKKVSISGGWFAILRTLHATPYLIHSAAKGITSNVQFSEGFSISVVDAIDGDEANATDRSWQAKALIV
jgi:hypothetical protein